MRHPRCSLHIHTERPCLSDADFTYEVAVSRDSPESRGIFFHSLIVLFRGSNVLTKDDTYPSEELETRICWQLGNLFQGAFESGWVQMEF